MTNIKFFDLNLLDVNTVYTFTSALIGSALNLYDNARTPQLVSVGSDDVTPEVWEFDFDSNKDVKAIFIDNHNIKSGNVQYWNGAIYTDFSPAITLSGNTETTNFYRVTGVFTQKIRLTMNTTQVVDDEKRVGEFRAFDEIGELNNNPSEYDQSFLIAKINRTTVDGGSHVTEFGKKYNASFLLPDAPQADEDLMGTLYDRNDPFYIYPSGGTVYTQRGFRLQDMFFVNLLNDFEVKPKNSLLGIGSRILVEVGEV